MNFKLIITALVALHVASCGCLGSAQESKGRIDKVAGSWRYSDGRGTVAHYVFEKNLKFIYTFRYPKMKGYFVRRGIYSVNDSILRLEYKLYEREIPFAGARNFNGRATETYSIEESGLRYLKVEYKVNSKDGLERGNLVRQAGGPIILKRYTLQAPKKNTRPERL